MRIDKLHLAKSNTGTLILCTVEGAICDNNYRELQQRLTQSVYKTTVVMDLSKVSYLTSAGLGSLIALIEYSHEAERNFYIMRPSHIVRILIESSGFPEYFQIIEGLDEIE